MKIFIQVIANKAHAACLRGFVLLSTLNFLSLLPCASAVSPPPDGGYAGRNTAEGQDALFHLNLSSARNNSGLGYDAIFSTTIGSANTAIGASAASSNTVGLSNTATGSAALSLDTTGSSNTVTGFLALGGFLTSGYTGSGNTVTGTSALLFNQADFNTATGYGTLSNNTIGNSNTGNGYQALMMRSNISGTGSGNVANGSNALYLNTGSHNTATGVNALYNNAFHYNTATGYQALESNTRGSNNSAQGLDSLNANTTGNSNTANGAYALFKNVDGNSNTADGDLALHENTSGINNTALGANALYGNTTGGSNVAIGFSAGFSLTTGGNNIDIGNLGIPGDSGIIRMGKTGTQTGTYIAGIAGVPITGGSPVKVSSIDQLGIGSSSARFKEKIKPMSKASEALLALKPVTFRYKKELDPDGTLQFGLVAEEVATVNPDLVTRDEQGKPYTVRYDAVNAMLLNEFLKKHRQGQEQERKIEKLEATISRLEILLSQRGSEIQTITDETAATESIGLVVRER
ncbi:MAG TPA: tail fiber domain-containing protein [Candidatus Udaeobacter sp.]|nr:tail fiber domain-containing protein [Candidatus Udaeobacter sp.]